MAFTQANDKNQSSENRNYLKNELFLKNLNGNDEIISTNNVELKKYRSNCVKTIASTPETSTPINSTEYVDFRKPIFDEIVQKSSHSNQKAKNDPTSRENSSIQSIRSFYKQRGCENSEQIASKIANRLAKNAQSKKGILDKDQINIQDVDPDLLKFIMNYVILINTEVKLSNIGKFFISQPKFLFFIPISILFIVF